MVAEYQSLASISLVVLPTALFADSSALLVHRETYALNYLSQHRWFEAPLTFVIRNAMSVDDRAEAVGLVFALGQCTVGVGVDAVAAIRSLQAEQIHSYMLAEAVPAAQIRIEVPEAVDTLTLLHLWIAVSCIAARKSSDVDRGVGGSHSGIGCMNGLMDSEAILR